MYCEKCGYKNNKGVGFCEHCGTKLNVPQQPVQQPQPPQPIPPQPLPPQPHNPPIGGYPPQPTVNNPVISVIRTVFTSPVYLTALIAFGAYLLFSFINVFTSSSFISDMIDEVLQMSGMPTYSFRELYEMISMIESVYMIFALLALIPAIILGIALLLIFLTMKDKSGMPIKTTGFSMIKGLSIYNIITSSLWGLVILILFLVMLSIPNMPDEVFGMFFAIFILAEGVVCALPVIVWSRLLSSMGTIKNSAISKTQTGKISGFFGVILFIVGVGAFLGAIISAVSAFSIMGLIASMCVSTAYICLGVAIFNYRNKMNMLQYSGNGNNIPPAGGNPYGGQPPYGYGQPTNPVPTNPIPAPPVAPNGEDTTVLSHDNRYPSEDTTVLNQNNRY